MSRRLREVLGTFFVMLTCDGCRRLHMRPDTSPPPQGWTTAWKETKRGLRRHDCCAECVAAAQGVGA